MARKKTHWCAKHGEGCPYSFPIEEGRYCHQHRCPNGWETTDTNGRCTLAKGHAGAHEYNVKGKDSDEVWGHSTSDSPEKWDGMCNTREEAIAEGRAEYGTDVTFYVLRGTRCDAKQFLPDVDRFLEDMGQQAGDEVGEAAEDFPDVSKEAKKELEQLLRDWTDKHVKCSFWSADGDAEQIDPLDERHSDSAQSEE